MNKPWKFIVLSLLILCSSQAFSAPIEITADYKHYDKYRDVLIAKGNVVVKGSDFRIEAPYIIRYFKDEKIVAMDKFTFEREGYRISGSNLEYNYLEGSGNGEKIRINFGETYLGARYMTMVKDKFELYDAYFTGCNEPSSHYHIAAQHLAFYPQTGLIVAYYATCWVWVAPVIPVPTFIYSSPVPRSKFIVKKVKKPSTYAKSKMEGVKSTQPVPELGSNDTDGWFIKQGFNWYFNPKQYLKFLLGYSDKKYTSLGVRTNYILNDENEGELRLASSTGDGFYWGMTHFMSFGPKLITKSDEDYLVYDFYRPGGKYSYELEMNYSYRERLNLDQNIGPFNRISFTPKTTFRSNRKPLPAVGEPFTYFWEASYANVSEEATYIDASDEAVNTDSPRTNYLADISYNSNWGWFGNFQGIVDISLTDYGELGSWDVSRQKLSLRQDFFDRLSFEYGHIHNIMQRGYSPYAFESYYSSPNDMFVGGITVKAWFSSFTIRGKYIQPSWDPYEISYNWTIGLHCYDLIFDYVIKRTIEDTSPYEYTYIATFNFSFELEPSRW